MRRWTFGLAGVAIAAAAALAVAPWTLPAPSARSQVMEQIAAVTGLDPNAGRISFSVLPQPRLKFENFTLRDGGRLVVSAKVIKGDLNLLALLRGRVQVSSIAFINPKITIDLDRGAPARGLFGRAGQQEPAQSKADPPDMPELRIIDGSLSLKSAQRKMDFQAHDIEALVRWPSPQEPASFRAEGVWRGRRARLTAWFGDPGALLRDGSSPTQFAIKSELATGSFDGVARSGSAWGLEGRADLRTPALRSLVGWLGAVPAFPGASGQTQLDAKLQVDDSGLTFSDLNLLLAGSRFDGEAALRLGATRPVLAATLACDDLELAPYLAQAPALLDRNHFWNSDLLPSRFGPVDLDLRISAAEARLRRATLSDMGLAVLVQRDRLDISLPEAKGLGGRLRGRFALVRNDRIDSAKLTGDFENVDAGSLVRDLGFGSFVTGSADGDFSLASQGATVADLVTGAAGEAKFRIKRGELVGLDFEEALRRVQKRPLSVAAEVHGGRTDFDALTGRLTFEDGKAALDRVELSGPGTNVQISGETLLADRSLNIEALAEQAGDDGAPSRGGSRLNVWIKGYWDDPRLVLDAESLIRSSRAAAPLFAPASDRSSSAR